VPLTVVAETKSLPEMSMILGEPSRGCTCFPIKQVLKCLNSQLPDSIANVGQIICSHLGRGESCAPNSRSRGYVQHSSSFTVDASFTPSSSSSSSFELNCVVSRFVYLMMFIPRSHSLDQKVLCRVCCASPRARAIVATLRPLGRQALGGPKFLSYRLSAVLDSAKSRALT
jgi:hypothetical protein